jgi:hypothetical protein
VRGPSVEVREHRLCRNGACSLLCRRHRDRMLRATTPRPFLRDARWTSPVGGRIDAGLPRSHQRLSGSGAAMAGDPAHASGDPRAAGASRGRSRRLPSDRRAGPAQRFARVVWWLAVDVVGQPGRAGQVLVHGSGQHVRVRCLGHVGGGGAMMGNVSCRPVRGDHAWPSPRLPPSPQQQAPYRYLRERWCPSDHLCRHRRQRASHTNRRLI